MSEILRVAAAIPAFNESESIAWVVKAISHYALPIVVDDGSTDGTAEIAREAGAEVVSHGANRGYDCALASGLRRAVELGCDAVVTLDADGQHDPTLLQRFIESLKGGADLVVGIRDRHQRWSESLFAMVGKIVWGLRDPLCGMKGYRVDLLRRAEPMVTYKSIGTELALRAVRSGCHVVQIPILTQRRIGASRFGDGLRANLKISKALWLGLFDKTRLSS